jgi:hypothetical protein
MGSVVWCGEGGGRDRDIDIAAAASMASVERGVGGRQYALIEHGDDCGVQTCVHGVDPFFIFLSISYLSFTVSLSSAVILTPFSFTRPQIHLAADVFKLSR